MKKTAALTLLAATLFTGDFAMANDLQGEQHSVSAKLRKDTLPHTDVLTAHHRTCKKNPKMRDIVIEIQAKTHHIEGVEQTKLLELKMQYEQISDTVIPG